MSYIVDRLISGFVEFSFEDRAVAVNEIMGLRQQLAEAEKYKADAERYLSKNDKERLRIGREINRAARELPDLYEIHISVENGAGWVTLTAPDMSMRDFPDTVDGISFCISDAIDAAIAAGREL